MSRAGESTGEAAKSDVKDIAGKAGEVAQNLRDIGSKARDAATDRYNDLRDSATEYYEQGKERAKQWESSLETYVQEKPLQAVLIAAGVGVVLGLLWKRS